MRIRTGGVIAGGAAAAAAAAVASYPVLWRKLCLTWGATANEVSGQMPGDDLMPSPDLISTRAITVEAPSSAIWPWLVQMGSGRGGAYTYDWIENLFGLGMHSANEILPQFQDLKVGDTLPLGSEDAPRLRVEVVDPERALVVRSSDGNWVWAFGLYPEGKHTRLVSRNRIKMPGASAPARVGWVFVMEPGSLVMERKMLLGIRQRAERLAATLEAS
jgi:hypothetical protein